MNMDEHDFRHAENLLIAIRKATFKELIGPEVIAMARAYEWLKELVEDNKKDKGQ